MNGSTYWSATRVVVLSGDNALAQVLGRIADELRGIRAALEDGSSKVRTKIQTDMLTGLAVDESGNVYKALKLGKMAREGIEKEKQS